MEMVPKTNPEHIRQFVLGEPNINIFDVFAKLYSYCHPIFPEVWRQLTDQRTCDKVEVLANTWAMTVLPPAAPKYTMVNLNAEDRRRLWSVLDGCNNDTIFNLHCYTILKAINIAYTQVVERTECVVGSSLLNLNTDLGQVYRKQKSQVYKLLCKLVGEHKKMLQPSQTRSEIGLSRNGTDKGVYLRDYLDNFVYVRVPDECDLDVATVDIDTWMCLDSDLRDFRIAVVPLIEHLDQVHIDFFPPDSFCRIPYRFINLKQVFGIADRAVSILKRLSDMKVSLVVFPELCIPKTVRDAIIEGLKSKKFPNIKMVIAGSFHEQIEKLGIDWYNVAYVLNMNGEILWLQKKFEPNTIKSYQVKRIPALHSHSGYDLYEKIYMLPRVLSVRDTPIGRMAVIICSDLLLIEPYRRLLIELGVNVVFVPAMSGTLEHEFVEVAKDLSIWNQGMIIVSNACALRHGNSVGAKVSFIVVPAHPEIWWCRCEIPPGPCANRQCLEDWVLQIETSWPWDFENV